MHLRTSRLVLALLLRVWYASDVSRDPEVGYADLISRDFLGKFRDGPFK
jgi:hypothetical protein